MYQALEVRAGHEVLRLAGQRVFDEPLGRLRLRDPALQLVEVPAQHRAPAGRVVGVEDGADLVEEVAVGTGRDIPLYGEDVELVGIDLSPKMLAVARRRAAELGREVDLREGDAEQLPFPDASFDTVVCTLAVCAVPDRDRALAEMHRVLRPGGRLLLLDHAERRWLRGRPADVAERHGFVIERRERMRLGLIQRMVARK